MRVMIDSNVIVSAVYNPKSKPANMLSHVCENHEHVLCNQIIAECYDVVKRKFTQHVPYLDKLFISLYIERPKVFIPAKYLEMYAPEL